MISCTLSNYLTIHGLPFEAQAWLKQKSVFDLNRFSELDESIREKIVLFSSNTDGSINIPRGYLDTVLTYCKNNQLKISVTLPKIKTVDLNLTLDSKINYTSGTYAYQNRVINELVHFNTVRLQAAPGAGKTLCACLFFHLINKGPVLFLANRDKLIRQFIHTCVKAFNIKKEDIGIIKSNKFDLKPITVGSLPTLGRDSFDLNKIKNYFNIVFVDECHISQAASYRKAIYELSPQYLIGLSATPEHYSSEELNNLMEALLGKVSVVVKNEEIPGRIIPQIVFRETGKRFKFNLNDNDREVVKHAKRNHLQNAIATDPDRNNIIVNDCIKLVKNNYKILIICNRVHHGALLKQMLELKGINVAFPYIIKVSKSGKEEQKVDHKALDQSVEDIEDGKVSVLIGTSNLFKEGFDCPMLSGLIIAGPFSGDNTTQIQQTVGRVQRNYFHKTEAVVVDYVDTSTDMFNTLEKWATGRANNMIKLYGQNNYSIIKKIP